MNLEEPLLEKAANPPPGQLFSMLPDRWILSRLQDTIRDVTKALEGYQFNEACRLIYEFFWSDFCDCYIEISKLRIKVPNVQKNLIDVLETTLRLLHPVMPFISEEIWQKLPGHSESIMKAPWPEVNNKSYDSSSELQMELLRNIITAIRNLRAEFNISLDKKPRVIIHSKSNESLKTVKNYQEMILKFAHVSEICYDVSEKPTKQVAIAVVGDLEIYLLLEGVIDLDIEKRRLTRQIEDAERELKAVKGRLANSAFVKKAPWDVIEGEKKKQKDLEEKEERLNRHLTSI